MTTTEIVPVKKHKTRSLAVVKEPAASQDAMFALIERAVFDPACDVSKLERLLAVKKELDADNARKAFVVALSHFKENPPDVLKSKSVGYNTTDGGTVGYKHATLDKASSIIGAAAAKFGLSHRWNVDQSKEGKIKVTCILTHSMGHSESVTMECQPDVSGKKNAIQAIGSAVTYLQRYSLFASYGIASKDDDDGAKAGKPVPASTIPGPKEAKPAGPATPTSGTDVFKVGKEFVGKSKGQYVFFEKKGGILYHLTEAEAKTAKANFSEGDTASVDWELREEVYWIKNLDRKAAETKSEKEF
jgi:hypothetical protein